MLINLATTGTQNNIFIYSGGVIIDTNGKKRLHRQRPERSDR